ncbi:hypothetical protein [Planomonospora parontospora]|uniref:hypothetical protein n=1 Tax=Planomonospora parontospora TaxID=58119 RepID=UPI001670578D|nr:hypothetical protein [Planomonospora parontospora]GGL17348.1 hypothetical protein GCM10014719_19340 [Planomonospora parontospora subsp. antibiotica]GII15255.1 hypothetical protein Ppa05_19810 [Planomonospora parontospora subsp. antibiotica]
MSWILAAVGLGFAGVAVLGLMGARVLFATRELGREVDRTRRRLEGVRDPSAGRPDKDRSAEG